jgi:hypothetical protein
MVGRLWICIMGGKQDFEKMLDRCKKDYVDCAIAKDENFSAETLFLVLIFEQQKMINELIRKLVILKHMMCLMRRKM